MGVVSLVECMTDAHTCIQYYSTGYMYGSVHVKKKVSKMVQKAGKHYNETRMNTIILKTGWLKLAIGWLVVFLIRLIPFRPPNFEPMLAAMMPYAKGYGALGGFAFGFLGIVVFDLVTSGIGIWTAVTAFAYGALGIGAYFFFRSREASTANFVCFGIVGTILYDAATGLTIGPIFYHQPFMVALIGQIPFTLMHVLGTVVFSIVVSPVLYRWVVKNDALEIPAIASRLGFTKN